MSNMAKVGLFAVIALAVLGYLIIEVEDLDPFGDEGARFEANFDSVAGLDDKAAVRIAGVRVGRVDGIRLVDQRAVVGILLDPPIELPAGTRARVSSLGLLGDKYVELVLGPPGGAPLAVGAQLSGETPLGWDEAVAGFSDLGASLQESLAAVDPQATGDAIRSLLANLEQTSVGLRQLIAANRGNVDRTAANFERLSGSLADELPRLTAQIDRVLDQVELVVAENRTVLRDSLAHIAEVSGGMRASVDDLNRITGTIAAGEGTLGKLIASDEAHDQLTSTLDAMESGIESLSETLGTITKLELDLSLDGYVLEETSDTRTEFALTLDAPDNDRFYHLGIVDDPRGRLETRTESVIVTGDDGVARTTVTETEVLDDDLTFSAQFGFRFGDGRLRAGIFESSGGAALDYGFLDERLWMSLEAFDFGRERDLEPHLRLVGQWHIHPNVYLLGGLDDFLESERETVFFGAGVRWSDDDLKYLLGALPTGF